MKNIILLMLSIAAFGLSSCVKCMGDMEVEIPIIFESEAIIHGLDLTLCACCGGYLVSVTDIEETNFRIHSFPAEFESTLDTVEFPITVNLNFTETDTCSVYRFLDVDEIEIVE